MGKDSSEIRREIEATRERMGDTVEALSYKADVPARMKDAVNERVETVKGTIGDVVGNVKDALSGASDKVGTVLGGAKDRAGTTWSDTSDKLGDTVGGVTNRLGDVTDKLPSTGDVTSAAKRGVGIVLENPLGLAIGAAAVGFLAGLMAPVTDYERDTIGPIRDDLVDKAQSMGSDVIEHGKAVLQETAQAALSTAQQSAQTHGQQVVQSVQGDNGDGETAKGKTSSEYGVLLDDTTPGALGTSL
jgi:ElaB/YqjD/DUF883 family membrane-anchored ribosome-binding protein